jgi:predicted aldo/keto reductase-like oxidoreductase
MRYRNTPRFDTDLSVLGFGCMRFPRSGVSVDMTATEKLLTRAFEAGVNYYDTAYMYPGSEEALGKILSDNGLREKVYIATKLPQMGVRDMEHTERLFAEELRRLRTDYIDYYLMHNFSDFSQWERLCGFGIEEWISEKKHSGAIRNIGFSFHGAYHEFARLIDAYSWDIVQIQYNYINEHYQAGADGLKYAASKGLPVVIMEPLMGGRLANVPSAAADIFEKARPGSTPAEWALDWLWNQPEVTVILSGMNAEAQLEENLRLASEAEAGMLSAADGDAILRAAAIVKGSYKVDCTGCNYCMPCPKGINIPALFSAYNTSYAERYFTGLMQYMNSVGGLQQHGSHYASDCIGCGACEKKCPQHIEIRENLKKIKRRFELPGLKLIPKLASKFVR